MSISRQRLAATAALAIVLAACGSSAATQAPTAEPTAAPTAAPTAEPTPAPTESLTEESPTSGGTEGRTGRIEVDGKFEITLADGWVEVALNADDIQAIIDAFPEDSEMAATLEAQLPTLIAAGVKLWAIDLQSGGPGTNLNVLVQPSGAISLQLLRVIAEQGLAQVPGIQGAPEVSDLTVDGQDAVQIAYRLTQAMADGTSVTVDGTQVYVSTETEVYIFTFTIMSGGDDADVAPMVQSIEFTS
jgi:hypothetical protein